MAHGPNPACFGLVHELGMIFTLKKKKLTFIEWLSTPGAMCLDSCNLHCALMRSALLESPFIREETETKMCSVTQVISCRARIWVIWLQGPRFQPACCTTSENLNSLTCYACSAAAHFIIILQRLPSGIFDSRPMKPLSILDITSNLCRLWIFSKGCPSGWNALLPALPF